MCSQMSETYFDDLHLTILDTEYTGADVVMMFTLEEIDSRLESPNLNLLPSIQKFLFLYTIYIWFA